MVLGLPLQRMELSFKEESFSRNRKEEEEADNGMHAKWRFGLRKLAAMELLYSMLVERVDDDKLIFESSFPTCAVSSFMNMTMAWRHSGQAILPGGPWTTIDVWLVEHRYNAHLVQNS